MTDLIDLLHLTSTCHQHRDCRAGNLNYCITSKLEQYKEVYARFAVLCLQGPVQSHLDGHPEHSILMPLTFRFNYHREKFTDASYTVNNQEQTITRGAVADVRSTFQVRTHRYRSTTSIFVRMTIYTIKVYYAKFNTTSQLCCCMHLACAYPKQININKLHQHKHNIEQQRMHHLSAYTPDTCTAQPRRLGSDVDCCCRCCGGGGDRATPARSSYQRCVAAGEQSASGTSGAAHGSTPCACTRRRASSTPTLASCTSASIWRIDPAQREP